MDSNAHNWRFILFFDYFCRWLHGISTEFRLIAVFFCTFAACVSVSLVSIWLVGAAAAAFVMDFSRSCCTHSNFSSISYFRRAPYFALTLSFRSHTGLCLSRALLLLNARNHTHYRTLRRCVSLYCVCMVSAYSLSISNTTTIIALLASRATSLSLCNHIVCMRYTLTHCCKRCSSHHSHARMLLALYACVLVCVCIRVFILCIWNTCFAICHYTLFGSSHKMNIYQK